MRVKIDVHTHIFPQNVIKKRDEIVRYDKNFSLLYKNPKSKMIDAKMLIQLLDESEFERCVTFSFPFKDMDLIRTVNDYVIESAKKYEDRIIPFAVLNLLDIDESISELLRCKNEISGVGELAFYTNTELFNIDRLKPFMDEVTSLGIPILLHCNETVGHNYPGKSDISLKKIYEFVAYYKDVTFILAHFGGGLFFYELMPEVKKELSHVFYDTAASPYLYDKKIYKIALQIVGEKLLFGSDLPLIKPKRYIKDMREVSLSDAEILTITSSNPKRIFG